MLSTLFSELCPDGVPVGDDVWEISRLVTRPEDSTGTSVLKLHRWLALALVEFAGLNNIRRYTLVAEPARVPALLSVGWKVVPLGLPTELHGAQLQALQIDIAPDTLETMRRRLKISAPALRIARPARRAA
jgi:N-acyl-L-homoserine lactone synthetase